MRSFKGYIIGCSTLSSSHPLACQKSKQSPKKYATYLSSSAKIAWGWSYVLFGHCRPGTSQLVNWDQSQFLTEGLILVNLVNWDHHISHESYEQDKHHHVTVSCLLHRAFITRHVNHRQDPALWLPPPDTRRYTSTYALLPSSLAS